MAHNHAVIEPGMTALVTGASSGIGEQFARQLGDRGVNLVLVARNRQRLEDLAADLRQRHDDLTVSVHPADLAETTGASQLAATLEADGVMVDLLINNAGTGLYANFIEQDPGAITSEIQLDCLSLVALTRQFLPGMVTRQRGGIINMRRPPLSNLFPVWPSMEHPRPLSCRSPRPCGPRPGRAEFG